jgi:ubiquinone/menaquinone biosynthesis C-methylase UbiE
MTTSETVSANHPHHSHHRRHSRLLLVSLLGGLGLAAILLAHGADWWSAPVAVVAVVVLGHLVALGGLLGIAAVITRSKGHGAEQPRGDLIRTPRLYDWIVRVLSGGREQRLREAWLDLGELRPGESMLDVGCGTGSLLLAAAGRVGPGGVLSGVEAAPEMLEHARAKARERDTTLDLHVGSADRLPFPDASFDVVFCTLVFHHLPRDVQERTLAEICRVLAPRGRVVIVDLPHDRHAGHHASGGALPRLRSLVELIHSGQKGRVVDVEAVLRELGAAEVTQHPGGMRALRATRAVFS